MTDAALIQKDLQCPSCAGQCSFVPETGKLTCNSCGNERGIMLDPDFDPTTELHYAPDLPHTEQPRRTNSRSYQCQSCGGTTVFPGQSISQSCPYCQGHMVEHPTDETYQTLGMIPFQVSRTNAEKNMKGWIRKRWAAPFDLSSIIEKAQITGIYVPFWTFDSQELVNYTVKYMRRRGKWTYTRTHSDKFEAQIDDLLVPASAHVTPLIRDGILHDFDPQDLRPFEPAFVAGFAAELHHQSVKDGLLVFESDKDLLLRNHAKKHSQKHSITSVTLKTHTSGLHYRRILLPVWIMHYRYDNKHYKVVTCGLKGRTFGERPFARSKLLVLSAVVSAAVIALGFITGIASAP